MISPDELNRYFQQRTEQNSFSGVVLITQGNSQLFAAAYGYASRSWKVLNTFTMRFDSASVTKLFTSVATLQLIDRGLLAFDTPVIDFLGLHDTAISGAVNVFHLLTHTSGIADDADDQKSVSTVERAECDFDRDLPAVLVLGDRLGLTIRVLGTGNTHIGQRVLIRRHARLLAHQTVGQFSK